MPVYWLSFHAPYRCRHSGDCCTAGWPIPIEADRLARVRGALAAGHLAHAGSLPFGFPHDAPDASPAVLAMTEHGCAFFRPDGSGSCAIQHALGHDALPLACRQFPRVSVIAPDRICVTLSHYCPTARALLETDAGARIVTMPESGAGEYVGLDVREGLPPLLRPGVLMDWDAYWEFEARSVAWLTEQPAAISLVTLRDIIEDIRTWQPGAVPLLERVRSAFDSAARQHDSKALRAATCTERTPIDAGPHASAVLDQVLGAVPVEWQPERKSLKGIPPADRSRRHFLAAHAFANWTAHLGQGLRTWLRSIETADALFDAGLGIREADLLLRHLAEPADLARMWSAVERGFTPRSHGTTEHSRV